MTTIEHAKSVSDKPSLKVSDMKTLTTTYGIGIAIGAQTCRNIKIVGLCSSAIWSCNRCHFEAVVVAIRATRTNWLGAR